MDNNIVYIDNGFIAFNWRNVYSITPYRIKIYNKYRLKYYLYYKNNLPLKRHHVDTILHQLAIYDNILEVDI